MDRIYTQVWMSVPKLVRHQLVKDFNIRRTGNVEVINDTVVTDGYTNADLMVFTIDSMTHYAQERGSFSHLWDVTVEKAMKIVDPPADLIEVSPNTLEVAAQPKYCDKCASKGGRHLKYCPEYK